MNRFTSLEARKRLLGCIAAGLVLSLMIGQQEGTMSDFGLSFHKGLVAHYRWFFFILVGIAIFIVITFWPVLARYIRRPGALGVGVGFLLVLVSLLLMNWYDPVGKFGDVSSKVSDTNGLDFLPSNFFGWLAWTLWIGCLVLGGVAIIARSSVLGYVLGVVGVASAVVAYEAHDELVTFAGGIDHSLAVYVATIGFLVSGGAGVVIARADSDIADPAAFVEKVMGWRPGLPLILVAAVLSIIALVNASWFSPQQAPNLDFSGVRSDFKGTGLPALASNYISWLGVTLAVVALLVGVAATVLRNRLLGVVTAVLGLAGVFLTFYSIEKISRVGSKVAPQYGKFWKNLGAGGWVMCIAFSLVLAGGLLCARLTRRGKKAVAPGIDGLPFHAASAATSKSSVAKSLLPVAIIIALFYPPTLTGEWQNTLVTQIGPYLLLAVGLNVVVGWAGLLDLGYIAFYAVGAYTTAYITGSLPVKPPSFLLLSPLWAIPFAVLAALIAGVLLGAPTLRLRGDYLAIVTLGFGEIIQVFAINNPGGFTGGSTGPNVPHPVFKLGPIHITWGLDNLPYWYLLLVLLVIVVLLFYRLEGSRLGRAWAAIREDEVAAQATGIDTTKVKLLAFAIGASTSGLAGVFFATQTGYFDPSLFTLQNSILIVAYVVFGGMGSLPGAIAGAAVLTWLPVFLKDQVPAQDRQMWIGAILLAMMIFRPAGLIPAKRRKAELAGLDTADSAEVVAVPPGEGL